MLINLTITHSLRTNCQPLRALAIYSPQGRSLCSEERFRGARHNPGKRDAYASARKDKVTGRSRPLSGPSSPQICERLSSFAFRVCRCIVGSAQANAAVTRAGARGGDAGGGQDGPGRCGSPASRQPVLLGERVGFPRVHRAPTRRGSRGFLGDLTVLPSREDRTRKLLRRKARAGFPVPCWD